MNRSAKEIQTPRNGRNDASSQSGNSTAEEVRARLHRLGGRSRMPLTRRIARAERGE
jgi:hypothetical protein